MSEHHPIREANAGIEHALHLDARRKLRIVALVDVAKATAAVAIGVGLLGASGHALELGGASLLRLLEVDPGGAIARRFLGLLQAADGEHGLLALGTGAYAALRLVEAWGLWRLRGWARWLGLVSAGIYVPFELYYLLRTPSWASAGVLAVNLVVLWLLWPRHPLPTPPMEASQA